MYYMGFTYREAMELPIWQRKWFIDRIVTEMKNAGGQSRAAHDNTADQRTLTNKMRSDTPAKLRRFT